eukprot:Skav235478  [mRNA]  locus=scaffold1269:464000:470377:- [translate_table: standard]
MDFSLTVLNSWQATHPATFLNQDGSSRIDFVLTKTCHADEAAKAPTYHDQHPMLPITGPRHIPISAWLRRRWYHRTNPQPSFQQMRTLLLARWRTDSTFGHTLHTHTEAALQQLSASQVLNDFDSFHATLHSHLPSLTPTSPPFPTLQDFPILPTPMKAFAHHTKTLRRMREAGLTSLFHAWYHLTKRSIARQQMRHNAKARRKEKIRRIMTLADEAAQAKDHFRLYQAIRHLSPKQPYKRVQIRTDQGLILDPSDAADDIAHWLQDLYHSDVRLHPSASFAWPFTCQDLATSLAALPATKALAPQYVPAPVWIQSADEVASFLDPIIRQWCIRPDLTFPPSWGAGHLVFLHKPGKKGSRPADLRPIALLEPTNKVVMGMLAAAFMSHAGHHLRAVPQFAYHEARGCGDAIDRLAAHCLTVRDLLDSVKFRHHHASFSVPKSDLLGGIMFSLDLTKAFDRVNREKLLQGMVRLGIPDNLINLLATIYRETTFTFEYRGEHRTVYTHQGIRQGCKAAPCCWSIFITDLLHTLMHQTARDWIMHNNTIYADDWIAHALITSPQCFHQVIHRLGQMLDLLEETGMQPNLDKTQIMLRLTGPALRNIHKRYLLHTHRGTFLCIPRTHGMSRIRIVDHIAYLGVHLHYTKIETATMTIRMKSGQTATALLHRWLFSRQPLRVQHRIRLWRQCILPCHWYGLLHVGFRKHDIIRLDQHWMRQLRRITCQPAHLTHLSNVELLTRFAIPDPLVQFRDIGLNLQARKHSRSFTLEPTDILHSQPPCRLSHLIAILDECIQVRRARDASVADLDPGWTCFDCNLTFSSQAQYRRHLTLTHDQRLGQLRAYQMTEAARGEPTCSRCNAQFTTWHAFKYHIQFVCVHSVQEATRDPALDHRVELRRYLAANLYNLHLDKSSCEQLTSCCCLCLRICAGEAGLLHHFAQDHASAYGRHGLYLDQIEHAAMKATPCAYCLAPVQVGHQCIVHRQLALLIAHDHPSATAPAVSDRLHQCHCGKAFVTAHGLKQHQDRVHAHARPVLTDEDRELLVATLVTEDWQDVLDRQSILTALSTGCVLCEQTFSKRALLTRHLRQEHARHWICAADQSYQLESMYKADGTCFCEPQLPGKHTCVIFLQLALLQRHWVETCQEDVPNHDPPVPPAPLIAPSFSKMIKLALRMGSIAIILQSNTIRLHLNTRCLLCNQYHADYASLLNHFLQTHKLEWEQCLPFLNLLQNTFFATKGCTCFPAQHKGAADHICATLAQIALAAGEMTDFLVLPYTFSSLEATPKLSPWLPNEQVHQLLEWLLSRNFEEILRAEWIHQIFQMQCIVCGQAFLTDELVVHLWNHHVHEMKHATPVLQMLETLMATMLPEHFCPLCQQILEDDTMQALMNHLNCRCTVLLQAAILLTLPNHDHAPYEDTWPDLQHRRRQIHKRQLTLIDGMARVLQPSDPTDSTLISTWNRLLQHVYVEPILLEQLRLKCWHCQQLFLNPQKLLAHLRRFHDSQSARVQICYANLAQDLPTAEGCPLSCECVHLRTQCPVILQLACILCDSNDRSGAPRSRRRNHGVLETHHSTEPPQTTDGTGKRLRPNQGAPEEATTEGSNTSAPAVALSGGLLSDATMDGGNEQTADSPRRCVERIALRTTVHSASRSGRTWHSSQFADSNDTMEEPRGKEDAPSAFSGLDHGEPPERAAGLPLAGRHPRTHQAARGQAERVQRPGPDAISFLGPQAEVSGAQSEATANATQPSSERTGRPPAGHAQSHRHSEIPLDEKDDSVHWPSGHTMVVDGDCEPGLPNPRGIAQTLLSFGLASCWSSVQAPDAGSIPAGEGHPSQDSGSGLQATLKAVRVLSNPTATCCFANAPLQALTWQTLLLSHHSGDGWARGTDIYELLTTFTPQPFHVVEDQRFKEVFRGFWHDFSIAADAFEFTLQMLQALQPKQLCNGWMTQPAFKGFAQGTELDAEKSPDLTPVQLNVFSIHQHSCTLATLISNWHDSTGFPKGLLSHAPSIVLSMPRTDDAARNRNQVHILECDVPFSMPYFVDLDGEIEFQSYMPIAVTFHLGRHAMAGHFRTALKVSDGWLAYEDGSAPERWMGLTLPSNAQIIMVWALRMDLWTATLPYLPRRSTHHESS